jgi:hypothetical protein
VESAVIIANLATYPPRKSALQQIIPRLSNQVDKLNVILNEYTEVPQWNLPPNVNFIIPPEDLKDCGKFYPRVASDDAVLLVDDDILYPPDYVAKTLDCLQKMPSPRYAVGYHGSFYRRPDAGFAATIFRRLQTVFDPALVNVERKVFYFKKKLDNPVLVDQLGTGTVAILGRYMPSFEYMKTSQKFVDVRLAKWFFEQRITPVCAPRQEDWLMPIEHEETIYEEFTLSSPDHVAHEIRSFSLRRPEVGKALDLNLTRLET